jgi:hypothetical protein
VSRSDHELDLGPLGLDQGGTVLLRLCLAELPVGARLRITGDDAGLAVHLRAFARNEGHDFVLPDPQLHLAGPRGPSGAPLVAELVRGAASSARWLGAERAGAARSDDGTAGTVAAPPAHWGLAARGAAVSFSMR